MVAQLLQAVARPLREFLRPRSRVSFEVYCDTQLGERVVVVGSHPDLGDWDQDRSQVTMSTDEHSYPIWTAAWDFTPGTLLEFKFLVLGKGSEDRGRWEDAIINRTLQVPEAGEARVTARFNCAEGAQAAGLAAIPSRPMQDAASTLAALSTAVRRAQRSVAELAERGVAEATRRAQAAELRKDAALCRAEFAERRAARAEEQAAAAEAAIADMRRTVQDLQLTQCGNILEFTEGRVEQIGSGKTSSRGGSGEIGVQSTTASCASDAEGDLSFDAAEMPRVQQLLAEVTATLASIESVKGVAEFADPKVWEVEDAAKAAAKEAARQAQVQQLLAEVTAKLACIESIKSVAEYVDSAPEAQVTLPVDQIRRRFSVTASGDHSTTVFCDP